jgi:hypothetical protein
MEYNANKKEIKTDRLLSELDNFVLDFVRVLEKYTNYVIISGYVSILLGRSRATEDVDLLAPQMLEPEFIILWKKLNDRGFECINTSNPREAFEMLKTCAIRFFEKGNPIPNIEFKLIKMDLEKYAFENKIKVILGDKLLNISPLELQIAYKLFLASDGPDEELKVDKDIEDAKHLYQIFKEKINKEELLFFIDKLNVGTKFKFLE